MQRLKQIQHFVYDQGVTPWNQQQHNLFALTTLKHRNTSLPTRLNLKNKSQPIFQHPLINKFIYKKQPMKPNQTIFTKAHTIQFQIESKDNKKNQQKQILSKQLSFKSPSLFKNRKVKSQEHFKTIQQKKKQIKNRSNSYQFHKSKYNKDFRQIESIKIKQLVINTSKNFFQPLENRSKQRFSNRVSQMLSIIRKAMHKQGPIAKLIKKRNKSRLKTENQLEQIKSKR